MRYVGKQSLKRSCERSLKRNCRSNLREKLIIPWILNKEKTVTKEIWDISGICNEITENLDKWLKWDTLFGGREWDIYVSTSTHKSATCKNRFPYVFLLLLLFLHLCTLMCTCMCTHLCVCQRACVCVNLSAHICMCLIWIYYIQQRMFTMHAWK